MKRIFILLMAFCAVLFATAQDVIFLGANDSIIAKVVSIGASEITYQKWSNLEGPIYSIKTEQIVAIRYANGSCDFFNNKEPETTQAASSHDEMLLSRSGNTYYSEGLVMNKKETLRWLETQNCSYAYEQFRKGYITANVGWGLFGVGFAVGILGAALYRNKIYLDKDGNYKGYVTPEGPALLAIGSAVLITSIPTIAVGYGKMHNTVHAYNALCTSTSQVRPFWSVQASNNGLGIAYNF